MSGVFFALRGVRILAFRRLSPEGRCPIRLLEWRKKRDSAGKRTDLKAPGKRCQLRQDCFGAQYVRQYRQVLLQAKPYISGAVART